MKGLIKLLRLENFISLVQDHQSYEKRTEFSMYIVNIFLLAVAIIYSIFFWILKVYPLVLLNVTGIIAILFQHLLLSKKRFVFFQEFLFLQLFLYTIVIVIQIGWGGGYEIWIFAYLTAYLLPFYTKQKDFFNIKILPAFIYIFLYFLLLIITSSIKSPFIKLESYQYDIIYLFNVVIAIICITEFCIFFSYKSVFDRKEIKKRSDYDTLTNLPNRYAITETGEDYISLSRKNDVYLAIIDIDFFKKINDTYGHFAGDKALINLADILRLKSSERGFFVGRYGGEEFVILSNSSTEDEFYHSLNELRKTVENNSFTYEDNVIKFTISGGMTKYKANNSFADLLANADKNLYIAKEKGRNIIIR